VSSEDQRVETSGGAARSEDGQTAEGTRSVRAVHLPLTGGRCKRRPLGCSPSGRLNHAFGLVAAVAFALAGCAAGAVLAQTPPGSPAPPLQISGVYPHLAAFNQPDEPKERPRHGEAGIGAVVPWAERLWFLTYPQHKTTGSNDKLYEVDAQLNVVVRPESVGGTHACRMIHRESQQLILGPYFIDRQRRVRAVDLHQLRGRMTAVFRHLTDPANWVYFYDMEGALYEVNVRTLQVRKLFDKPVPGWHGKGGYTGQGRVVLANNGELGPADGYKHVLVGGPARGDEAGVLAEWDGRTWRIVERKQFCDVTGPGGLYGNPDDAPVWAIGWDRRSVILKLLDHGRWYTYRLPKASHTYDPKHGWYTEWPRIRELAPGRLALCMHGTLFDFPKGFCRANTAGVRPLCTHLRVIPDFCYWRGRVVLAADDASMMNNPLCGQAQSNLWFGTVEQLRRWGPAAGWGGPWLDDRVQSGQPSDPFLFAGYRWRCLHLTTRPRAPSTLRVPRCAEKFTVEPVPEELCGTVSLAVRRGDYHRPAPGYSFGVDRDVVVFLAVDDRGQPELDGSWQPTGLKLRWNGYTDTVYRKTFPAGRVEVPGRRRPHRPGAYPLPNLVFVRPTTGRLQDLHLTDLPRNLQPTLTRVPAAAQFSSPEPVRVTVQLDRRGDGTWTTYKTLVVPPEGYAFEVFPPELQAEWVRLKTDRDCRLTAYFHYWSPRATPRTAPSPQTAPKRKPSGADGSTAASRRDEPRLFAGLADADRPVDYVGGLIRPAAHNRSLQWLRDVVDAEGRLVERGRYVEVDLQGRHALRFDDGVPSRADEVRQVAAVRWDFRVDAASVVVTDHRGRRFRLPKGPSCFDRPFPTGWPRGIREVATERYLASIHGTFYEIPRVGTTALPDFERLKPVCSHNKLIVDF